MRYIALNGFRHPLDRYFTSEVECVNAFNWTPRNARRLAAELDQTDEPKTVIGFSDGASAAVVSSKMSRDVGPSGSIVWADLYAEVDTEEAELVEVIETK